MTKPGDLIIINDFRWCHEHYDDHVWHGHSIERWLKTIMILWIEPNDEQVIMFMGSDLVGYFTRLKQVDYADFTIDPDP